MLGAILLANGGAAFNIASEYLEPGDYSHERHRLLFAAMAELAEGNVAIDPVTLTNQLLKNGALDKAGGVAYMSDLTAGLPRAINTEHYAKIVKEKSSLRRLAYLGNALVSRATDAASSPGEIIGMAEGELLALGEASAKGRPVSLGQFFDEAYGSVDELIQRGASQPGLKTGFRLFDRKTNGLKPGELVIVAARPSMGKTAWALNAAVNIAAKQAPVLVFSLEMSREALFARILCAEARVDGSLYRTGSLSPEDRERIKQAADRLRRLPLFIDDTAVLRMRELAAKARRWKRDRGIKAVILDYLQLMAAPKAENRNQEVSAISRGLKLLAKDLGVPIVALSQLSRAAERREGDRRPQLSDLRDSGAIEQDADIVCFLYRSDYYRGLKGSQAAPVEPRDEGRAELVVAKQRNGPTGTCEMLFRPGLARFDNIEDEPVGVYTAEAAEAPDADELFSGTNSNPRVN